MGILPDVLNKNALNNLSMLNQMSAPAQSLQTINNASTKNLSSKPEFKINNHYHINGSNPQEIVEKNQDSFEDSIREFIKINVGLDAERFS